MHLQRLSYGLANPYARIQRRIGVLKHNLGLFAERPKIAFVERRHLHAVEPHLASRRFLQAEDASPEGGLAATRLADQAQGLALIDLQTDVVNGLHVVVNPSEDTFFQRIPSLQVLYL